MFLLPTSVPITTKKILKLKENVKIALWQDWRMNSEGEVAAEYFSNDFDWEELRSEIESNPSLRYHFESFSSSSSSQSPQSDVHAWKQFHTRHSTGKFFKERRYLLKEFPELLSSSPSNSNPKLLEVGCGNGSTILPILRYFILLYLLFYSCFNSGPFGKTK
jgi:hypothetical protein